MYIIKIVTELWKMKKCNNVFASKLSTNKENQTTELSFVILFLKLLPFITLDAFSFFLLVAIFLACLLPLQTVWTQIRPNTMSGLIWVQSGCHSDGIPERIFFVKSNLIEEDKILCKITQYTNKELVK